MQDALNVALARLWDEGCPMAHPTDRSQMIAIGLRRWRSFERRNRRKHPTRDDRVEDLAVGLRDAFEPDRKMVGPLMVHYRCVAEAIAAILAPSHHRENEDTAIDSVQRLWQQIETWLSNYAPHARQMLRPGASEEMIQQAEIAMNIALPEDFKASCRLHNGGYIIELVSEMTILPLKDIVEGWRMFKELEEVGTWSDDSVPYYFQEDRSEWQTGPIQAVWWHQRWIPIGRDRAGNHCCLDLAPAPGGSIGQIIDLDHEVGPSCVLASCFFDVLSTFAQDLEAGKYMDTVDGLEMRSDE